MANEVRLAQYLLFLSRRINPHEFLRAINKLCKDLPDKHILFSERQVYLPELVKSILEQEAQGDE